MKLKVKDFILEIETFSFSENNAWFYFSSEKYEYATIKDVFAELEVDTMLEILTDEDFVLEGHAGYDYLRSITVSNDVKQIMVELVQKPLADRIKNLEETVDILLMSEL